MEKSQASEPRQDVDQTMRLPIDTKDSTSSIRISFTGQRWRCLAWLTPFRSLELPVRVVREKASGKYFTFSKVLFRHKATRRLSPALEQ